MVGGKSNRRRVRALRPAALVALVVGVAHVAPATAQDPKFGVHDIAFGIHDIAFGIHDTNFGLHIVEFGVHNIVYPVQDIATLAEETEKEVRFRLSGDVLFDFDKADLQPKGQAVLRQLAARIGSDFAGASMFIEGHTDSKGSDDYNQALSERRAESVGAWFAANSDFPTDRITTVGYGESRPVAPNETEDGGDNPAGRQENRRVEFVVVK